jgi:hypothetical protein
MYLKINPISCIRWVNKNPRKFQKKFGITKELFTRRLKKFNKVLFIMENEKFKILKRPPFEAFYT